jgi:hypothetical protein
MLFTARKNHHKKNGKRKIYFFDQPPAKSVRELLDNIDGGSIFQFTIVDAGRWHWKLIVTRRGGVDAWADVWDVHLLCDNVVPSVTFVVSGAELARAVRQMFCLALGCQTRLPAGHRRMVSQEGLKALAAADAMAEESRE